MLQEQEEENREALGRVADRSEKVKKAPFPDVPGSRPQSPGAPVLRREPQIDLHAQARGKVKSSRVRQGVGAHGSASSSRAQSGVRPSVQHGVRPSSGGRWIPDASAAVDPAEVFSPEILSAIAEIVSSSGQPAAMKRLAGKLAGAARAYRREDYWQAGALLKIVVRGMPRFGPAHELYGLSLYRMGKWAEALRELEAYHRLTGSFDHYAVMIDCCRALGDTARMEAFWEELRQATASVDTVAEGRLVVAVARAERGDLPGGLALLSKVRVGLRHPRERHLRQWYVFADLLEQAGEVPRARSIFESIARHDPGAFDVEERLVGLR